jgi:hypothetical protein
MADGDYGLECVIKDLGGAVKDAVDRAHGEYEPKFYDWMKAEIDSHANDLRDDLRNDIKNALDTDNDNTEQRIGVNEVEEIVSNALYDYDFTDTIRDVLEYNYDYVEESDVTEIVRDYCDGEGYGNDLDLDPIREEIDTLRSHIMSMQAEIDFLHEKHVENVERRITERIRRTVESVCSVPGRVWARVPRFSIVRKAN